MASRRVNDNAFLEEQIVAALRQILRAVSIHSRQLLAEHGVTTPQLLVLKVVTKNDGITLSALARTVSLSQSTLSDIVRRLTKQGLVTQRVGEDRRSRLISPTNRGIETMRSSPSLLQEKFQKELARCADYKQTQILATLQEVAAMMDATNIDAAPILTIDALNSSAAIDSPAESSSPDKA